MVTPEQLRDACERAAQYRRQLAIAAGAPAGNRAELIYAMLGWLVCMLAFALALVAILRRSGSPRSVRCPHACALASMACW